MKTIAIAGCGPLLGLAIARKFGRSDFRVALIARREQALQLHVEQLRSAGIEAAGFSADLTIPEQVAAAFARIRATLGAVEVLEFSPTDWGKGTDKLTSATATTPDSASADFRLLVLGAINCTQQVLPDMIDRGQGTLIFTTGYSAIKPLAFITSLGIANSGLRNYAYCLSEDLSPRGVYVGTVSINAQIAPGTAGDPDKIADLYWDMYEKRDRIEAIFGPPSH